jgi:hypothetical protein
VAGPDFDNQIKQLQATMHTIEQVLDLDRMRAEIAELGEQVAAPDLWDDQANAQRVTGRLSALQGELERYTGLKARLDDLETLAELASEEGDADALAEAVADAAREAVNRERHQVLDRFDQLTGRPDGAVARGLAQVLAALRSEQVDTLLIDGNVAREDVVWIGEQPAQVALDRADLEATGASPLAQVPVDAALLRAAAGTGAEFYPLGGGRTGLVGRPVPDGVAALLRWPLAGGA